MMVCGSMAQHKLRDVSDKRNTTTVAFILKCRAFPSSLLKILHRTHFAALHVRRVERRKR